MRLSRLVIEANQNRVSLTLHPRLTVVAGVPAPVRAHLVEEILGGFTSSRSGVHLELVNSSGRRIRVLRPTDGAHSVNAPDDGLDLTDDFRSEAGRLDVLARYGLDSTAAHRTLHLGSDVAHQVTAEDADIARLSCLDQSELWSAAARVQVTQAEFHTLSEAVARTDDDADATAATIEKRHQSVESAVRFQQEIEQHLVRLTGFALLLALPVAARNTLGLWLLLAIASVSLAFALVFRAKVASARRREEAEVARSGSDSYLGYVVKQVDGLLDDTERRRRLSSVAADHRAAAIGWTRLAGDVTVEWALAHQAEIDAAARLQHRLAAMDTTSTPGPRIDETTAAVARKVLGQMVRLRRIGYGAESFPLLLDDPFVGLDPSVRLALLELIAASAGSPQVILLTEQDDVAAWARAQSRTGEVSLLEPLGPTSPTGRQADDGATRSGSTPSADLASSRPAAGSASASASSSYGTAARGLAV